MAGLAPLWVLDIWEVAIATLRKNFPGIHHLHMPIQDFATAKFDPKLVVDILHVSYPCQGHSRQNRGTNPERDAVNNVTVCCIKQLIEKCRPRIVTLEQTDHILTKNEEFFFRKVISELTSARYSVRWKVFNCADYGVPQARKRLMIMAAW